MDIRLATDPAVWDAFLTSQRFRPFLQSWTMGEVYRELGQEPIRLEAVENGQILGSVFAVVVPARRGRHLSVPYGPTLADPKALPALLASLTDAASRHRCAFLRLSPFWPKGTEPAFSEKTLPSPLHLLAEHLWYLPLHTTDPWHESTNPRINEKNEESRSQETHKPINQLTNQLSEEQIFKNFRSTQRNLVRRAEKDGVTITASPNPVADLHHFLTLHDETRKRHGFTPYTDSFFRAQVKHFAPKGQLTLYLAHYQNQVIASSIHMHFGGETSYHHGASAQKFRKIPASYLLQWTAIKDALKRGDHVYNFWGIAPMQEKNEDPNSKNEKAVDKRHPFAGVTLFKTGFGGRMLELTHCIDVPLSPLYRITRGFEMVRKWKRGF